MVGAYVTPGSIAGCDFSGKFVAVDSAGTNIVIGDRVCGAIVGMNPIQPDVGAFANYVGARADRVIRINSSFTYHDGAALVTSFMTAGLALFKSLKLPGSPLHPTADPKPVLVYGGSAATGIAAIQLLRLAGFTPIATCSPGNFELVKSAYTNNALEYTLGCITTVESMKICYMAIGRRGGRYTALDPYPDVVAKTRTVVKADWVLGPVMLGKEVDWPADPDMSEFGVEWVNTAQSLLDQERLQTHLTEVHHGGLDGALDGLERIKSKKVSGVKLVYSI